MLKEPHTLYKDDIMAHKLELLIWHCTATPEGREVSKDNLHQWHIVDRGWSRLGYRDMVHLNGELENLIEFDQDDVVDSWEISNGVRGQNYRSLNVVYVGGTKKTKESWQKWHSPKDTRTKDQLETMEIYTKFMIKRYPNIKVAGHNQFANKACPSFDTVQWCREIGIPEKNIYKV